MSQLRTFNWVSKKGFVLVSILIIFIAGALFIPSFFPKSEKHIPMQEQFNTHCGSCHIPPDPANITKALWKNKVLPEMAKRMGIEDYSPGYSWIEKYHIILNKAYPKKPMIDSLKWRVIQDYIIRLAPETIANTPNRKGRNAMLTQFKPALKTINRRPGGIVSLKYNTKTKSLWVGDVFGQLHEWKEDADLKLRLKYPVVSSVFVDSTTYVTDIGVMNPSEQAKGSVYQVNSDTLALANKLHRPVYTEVNDLNGNGEKEIIVCEFGHLTGELSLFIKEGASYKKKTLMALPGSAKVEVVDMNGDQKKDIVVLFAQGREGMYIFYQEEDLNFKPEQVIIMQPEFGLSWFSMLDYNNDGHLDMLLVNGDNADYSNFLKPYHGVRLYINNGENAFKEEWFYPINGATRVLVEDFDMDGDLDFAVLSFFPDFKNGLEEGFVYLENLDSENYKFKPHTTELATKGNWLVMEKGDFDQDGDTDIVLGSFTMVPVNKFKSDKKIDLLFLENTVVEK